MADESESWDDQIACECRQCWCWFPATKEKPLCWACTDGAHREDLTP